MNRQLLWIITLAIVVAGCQQATPAAAQTTTTLSAGISAEDLRAEVGVLASDELGGRLTGTPGAEKAAEYIAAAFKQAGLQPLSGGTAYYYPFDFAAGVEMLANKNSMSILPSSGTIEPYACQLDQDFRPLTWSASAEAEGDVVFAGYGLVEPGSEGSGYNAYQGLNVQDKIVLVLRDMPEDITPQRRQQLSLYAGMRYKAKLAADRGAKGFLLVRGPNTPGSGELVKFHPGDRTSSVAIPAASISVALTDRILAPSGMKLQALQTKLDGGELDPHAAVVSGARVQLTSALKRTRKTCRNVVAQLPPTGGSDEYVMVGAHYDHIGDGVGLGSLAKAGEEGQIHNGADDNASGTSVVLELAGSLAGQRKAAAHDKPQRGVIFACWSGEELGLIGSGEWAKKPPVPLDKIVAYVNFDMVGRLRDNKLVLQSVGSSPVWRRLIERRNIPAGFNLTLQNDPFLPTDATAFYTRGVPTLSFFTDLHDDYNRPSDDADTLNYEGMQRIAGFAQMMVNDVASPELAVEYVKVEQAASPSGRGGRRVYTGMVPDFAGADLEGMLVSDVRAGGPAAEAGVKGGDVIVEFAGQKIASLRDYSDALIGAKIGQEVNLVVLRNGERIPLKITPRARD